MSQNEFNIDNYNDEMKEYDDKIENLLVISKHQNNRLDEFFDELNSLKKELKLVKEINNKTKDFLLLELESNLDKQKQIVFNYDSEVDYYNEVINLLKEENACKNKEISSLTEKIGMFKQRIDDKDVHIKSLEFENDDFKKNIGDKEDKFNLLNKSISEKDDQINLLKNDLNDKVSEIDKIHKDYDEKIISLNEIIENNKLEISKLKEENTSLSNENNNLKGMLVDVNLNFDKLNKEYQVFEKKLDILKNESKEKSDNILVLKEEITILKSIIDEKDKTIDSLRGV